MVFISLSSGTVHVLGRSLFWLSVLLFSSTLIKVWSSYFSVCGCLWFKAGRREKDRGGEGQETWKASVLPSLPSQCLRQAPT